MSIDAQLISAVVKDPSLLLRLQRAGVDESFFVEPYDDAWRFLLQTKRRNGVVPSRKVVALRFPDIEWIRPDDRDLPVLLEDLKQRRKWQRLLDVLDTAAESAVSPERVDDAIQKLQGSVNELSATTHGSHIIDLFSREQTKKMVKEIQRRSKGGALGVPTGFRRIDDLGGMHRQRMITVIGRSGKGKTWLNLAFVANAVINGEKFILYPLEMTLEETAFRLYTIFSQKMFGAKHVIRNTDLLMGRVTKRKIVRFLHALEDRFAGQLYVADVGSLSDPYTAERVEAECSVYQPTGFWVDYITLLRSPSSSKGSDDHSVIRMLADGIKGACVRTNTIGGCSAQVNRESLKTRAFIPRLEHISFGDAIGQTSDQVVAINTTGNYLYYAMIKNRHGPEIRTTRVRWEVDEGNIEELADQEQGEEDTDEE